MGKYVLLIRPDQNGLVGEVLASLFENRIKEVLKWLKSIWAAFP